MGGTGSTDLVFFQGTGNQSDCESATNWSYGATDTDNAFQGTYCLLYSQAAAGSKDVLYTCASTNLTNKLLYFWIRVNKVTNLSALSIYIGDGTNWGKWTVTPSVGVPWFCFVIKTDQGYDSQSGTPNLDAVTKIGFSFTTTGKCIFYWDAFRYGTYIQIDSGTEGSPATLSDIWGLESGSANKYGVLIFDKGIYYIQGVLRIGSTGSGVATYFKDISKVIIFGDARIGSASNEILLQGNGTATTYAYFGTKSGNSGISGLYFKSEGAAKYKITATGSNVTGFGFYGCSFFDADVIYLPAASANYEILNSTLEASAQALVNTCAFAFSNFISADNKAFRITGSNFQVSGSNIISCPTGSEITTAGNYTFDALKFLGNTIDVENSSAGLVTINCVRGSDPSISKVANTGGGSTSIVNTVTLSVTVKDEAGNAINGSRVSIENVNYTSMKGVVADDGGSQTDETTVANDATANDMTLLPTVPAINDAYYFGSPEPFFNLRINIGTNGVGTWALVWEYYNGSTWDSLTVTDGTSGFTAGTGNREVIFNPPENWAKTTVKSIDAFWVRARITDGGSVTTPPKGTQSWIKEQAMNETTDADGIAQETDYNYPGSSVSVVVKIRRSPTVGTRYYPASTNQTIGSSGLNLTWTLAQDIIAS